VKSGVADKLSRRAYLDEMRRCRAVVANDSGPAHMAAAVGVPTLVLFGATRRTKNRPLGRSVHVIEAGRACSPCQYTPAWNTCRRFRCMEEISPDALRRYVAHCGPGACAADVLIVGVTEQDHSTNTFMRKAFQRLGLTVESYDYRSRAALVGGGEALARDFADFLYGRRFGLILFSKVDAMDPASIAMAGVITLF